MYRIGDFSFLMGISVKTLRYYDSIDLFKPNKIDKYTGYRYYSDEQIDELSLIMKYKKLGFSLEQIRNLMVNNNSNTIIKDKINDLTSDIIENEKTINKLNSMLEKEDTDILVEFRPYREKLLIGKRFSIDSRGQYDEKLREVKKVIERYGLTVGEEVFCNFEIGYEEENIDCFIGYNLLSDIDLDITDLEVIYKSKCKKLLIGTSKRNNINKLYQEMVKYANLNDIQIRGFYTEVYKEDCVTIYVEAYDLLDINEDYLFHLDHVNTDLEIDKELVGEYKIREILPDIKFMANPNKQKSMLDTKFNLLILKDDGCTNYDNIKWNGKFLLMKYDNRILPFYIHKYYYNNKKYLDVLMNESLEKSQRPMHYLYEEV